MTRPLRILYHFLGGVIFAIMLIAATALFVVAGTLLESATQSHRYAALFTYDNFLFSVLLWGFFVNILFAATRRWPFKIRHVPFLITHLGLLMVLAGVIVKRHYGVQGTMMLIEGGGSDLISLPDSFAVSVESKHTGQRQLYPIKKTWNGEFISYLGKNDEGLSLRLVEFAPHAKHHLSTWVKGETAIISGLAPMPLRSIDEADPQLTPSGKVRFHDNEGQIWELYAIKSTDPSASVNKLYISGADLIVSWRSTGALAATSPLHEALRQPLTLDDGTMIKVSLSLDYSLIDGFTTPQLTVNFNEKEMVIPLDGERATENISRESAELGHLTFAIDIVRQPALAILEDQFNDISLVAIDPHGSVWSSLYRKDGLDQLIAYDDGFGGYSVRAELPFNSAPSGRAEREEALAYLIERQLRQAEKDGAVLSPPLTLLKDACTRTGSDFPSIATLFMTDWDARHSWLYTLSPAVPQQLTGPMEALAWEAIPKADLVGCRLAERLNEQLGNELARGDDFVGVLKKYQWPLTTPLEMARSNAIQNGDEPPALLTLLTQQLFMAAQLAASDNLLESSTVKTPYEHALLLSAYFRAYGIHLSSIIPQPQNGDMAMLLKELHQRKSGQTDTASQLDEEPIVVETAVMPSFNPVPPGKQLEENLPMIAVHVHKGQRAQKMKLSYDRNGGGLKWPALDGDYLLRFQTDFKTIPYRLRLRQARQINYPNSSQPYSYESDLIITDKQSGIEKKKTISMNKVHETPEGYRFYLSSIAVPKGDGIKQVIVVVNYDPAKYWLTYPGAIILTLGIILLFTMRPYRRHDKKPS